MIQITKRQIPHSQDHWVRITRLIDNEPTTYLEFAATPAQLQELANQLLKPLGFKERWESRAARLLHQHFNHP